MKKYLFCLLCLMPTCLLQAQDSIPFSKSFSLRQGISHVVTKDLFRSPFVYSGLAYNTVLACEKKSAKSIHALKAGFLVGSIKTSFSPPAPVNMMDMNYSYLRKILNRDRVNFYVGGQVEGMSWRVNYFPKMDAPKYGQVRSYLLAGSAGITTRLDYRVSNRSMLRMTLYNPVFNYLHRPNFLDGSPSQTQFGFLNFWNPQLEVSYEYNVSRRVALNINYHYEYLQYSKPKPLRILGNGLSVGFKFRF